MALRARHQPDPLAGRVQWPPGSIYPEAQYDRTFHDRGNAAVPLSPQPTPGKETTVSRMAGGMLPEPYDSQGIPGRHGGAGLPVLWRADAVHRPEGRGPLSPGGPGKSMGVLGGEEISDAPDRPGRERENKAGEPCIHRLQHSAWRWGRCTLIIMVWVLIRLISRW